MLGRTLKRNTPRNILERGVAHIPEDRQKHGLILSFPMHDNLMLVHLLPAAVCKGINLRKSDRQNAET